MSLSRFRRPSIAVWFAAISAGAIVGWGCSSNRADRPEPGRSAAEPRTGKVAFVAFDASEALVEALKDRKIQGLVVQNPIRMGNLAIKTLVDHLEKRPVKPIVHTGEATATPENMNDPEIRALLHPPKEASSGPSTFAGGSPRAGKKWRIMMIPKGTTHEFWQSIHAGALQAAKELGRVELIWQGPQRESERDKQINLMQTAMSMKVDGIALAPLDAEALVAPVEAAIEKGIAVVIFDSALGETKPTTKPIALVATDNYHGGVLAARRLGEVLKGEGKIILMRYMVGSASTFDRERGFTDTIAKEFPKLVYLSDNQYAGATADAARKVGENLIARHGDQVDGIFCANESSAYGMLRALEAAGLVGTPASR